jgi:hypothetical protein
LAVTHTGDDCLPSAVDRLYRQCDRRLVFPGEVMTLQRMLAIGIIIIGVALLMKS